MSIQTLESKLQKLEKMAKECEKDYKKLLVVKKDHEESMKRYQG